MTDPCEAISVRINPAITPAQLYAFYERNGICEAGYSVARAAEVLRHSSVIVAAFDGDRLVAIGRAMSDGLAAVIMELSVELELQGSTQHANGSLIENDRAGVAGRVGRVLLDELAARGVDFFSVYVVEDCEETFYASLGFAPNPGHRVYVIDRRPY